MTEREKARDMAARFDAYASYMGSRAFVFPSNIHPSWARGYNTTIESTLDGRFIEVEKYKNILEAKRDQLLRERAELSHRYISGDQSTPYDPVLNKLLYESKKAKNRLQALIKYRLGLGEETAQFRCGKCGKKLNPEEISEMRCFGGYWFFFDHNLEKHGYYSLTKIDGITVESIKHVDDEVTPIKLIF